MLQQAEYRRLKTRLTRARNAYEKARSAYTYARSDGESRRAFRTAATVLQREAEAGLAVFDAQGYPDTWHDWERAADDAAHTLRYTA